MLGFRDYVDSMLLLEGGKAVTGVVRLNQSNAKRTIDRAASDLTTLFGIKASDVIVLGSAGKKDPEKDGTDEGSSGDIDVAVSIPAVIKAHDELKNFDDVYEFLRSRLDAYNSTGVRNMKGLKVLSIAYPIVTDGDQDGQLVQLDVMPVESLKYSEWAYYSPSYKESKWKGLYRNELMYAVAKYAAMDVKKMKSVDGKDVPTEWDRLFFDLNTGLMKGTQTRVGKKKEMTKGSKTTSKDLLSNDPDEISRIMFGNGVTAKDVLTFEGTLDRIMSEKFPYKENRDNILAMAAKGIKDIKKHELPKELEQYYG